MPYIIRHNATNAYVKLTGHTSFGGGNARLVSVKSKATKFNTKGDAIVNGVLNGYNGGNSSILKVK